MPDFKYLGEDEAKEVQTLVEERTTEVKSALEQLQEMVNTQQQNMRQSEAATYVEKVVSANPALADKRDELLEQASKSDNVKDTVDLFTYRFLQENPPENTNDDPSTPGASGAPPSDISIEDKLPKFEEMEDKDIREMAARVKAGQWKPQS